MPRRKRFTRNLCRKLKTLLPVRTTMEWVRFEHEREPYGVFQYVSRAVSGLPPEKRKKAETLRRWFDDNLGAPGDAALERFWFRSEAVEHIEKARTLAKLVSGVGIPIVERRIRRVPGKVRWEDTHQAAVLTYRDTPQPKRRGQ